MCWCTILDVCLLVLLHLVLQRFNFTPRINEALLCFFKQGSPFILSTVYILSSLLCAACVSFTSAMCGFQMIPQRNAAQRLLNNHRPHSAPHCAFIHPCISSFPLQPVCHSQLCPALLSVVCWKTTTYYCICQLLLDVLLHVTTGALIHSSFHLIDPPPYLLPV